MKRQSTTIALLIFTAVSFVNQLDRHLFSVLAEAIQTDLSLSDTQLGLLSGITFAVFYATFGVLIAAWSDRGDRVNIIALCTVAWSAMCMACGAAVNFLHILIARIGLAIGESGSGPAINSLMADYQSREKLTSSLSIIAIGGSLGIASAGIIGGQLAQALGWRWTFIIIGSVGIPIAILAYLFLNEPRRQQDLPADVSDRKSSFADIAKLLSSTSYILLTMTGVLAIVTTYGISAWKYLFFQRTFDLEIGEIGLWLGLITGVGSMIGLLISGYLGDRLAAVNHRSTLWIAFAANLAMTPLLIVVLSIPDWKIAVAAYFVPALLQSMWYAPVYSCILTTIQPDRRAMATAVALFLTSLLGLGIGPTAVGLMSDVFTQNGASNGLRLSMIVISFFSLISAAFAWFAYKAMGAETKTNEMAP